MSITNNSNSTAETILYHRFILHICAIDFSWICTAGVCVSNISLFRQKCDQLIWFIPIVIDYRIWSWSPMPCGKHGQRDSVDKCRGRRPMYMSFLRPEGHVFHTAWETMIKSYYSTLTDWFFFVILFTEIWNFSALKCEICGSLHGCLGNWPVAMDWLPRDTNE